MSLTSIIKTEYDRNAVGSGRGQVAPFRFSVMTAAVLVAVNAQAAKVDDRPPTMKLPPLEIIGQEPSQLEHIPGSGSVINKNIINSQGPLSSKDALRTVPGINVVDEDVLGRRFNFAIRGLDPRRGVRTQVLEDGMPIQLAPYSDPSNHYVPSMLRIDRIEVLKGSGQLIYGPQTIGGAINYVSPAIPEEFSGSFRGAGGNNGYYDAHVNLGGTIDNVGLSVDYVRQEADGNRRGQKQLLDDLALRSLIKFNDQHRLLLKGTLTHEEARMGEAGLRQEDFLNDPRTNYLLNDVFEVERYSGQALYEFDISEDMHFSTNIYGQYMSRESIRQASDSTGLANCNLGGSGRRDLTNAPLCGNEQRPRTYGVFGIEPRFVFNHDLFGVDSEATVGVRGHFEWVSRRRFVGNLGPSDRSRSYFDTRPTPRDRYQNNTIDTQAFSFFAQNKFFLGDFTVTPGVRVEYFHMENINRKTNLTAQQDYVEALPGIGATYNGFENITLFAGVHRGFAPPRPDETLSPTTGTLNVVNPETSLNYEVGLRTQPVPGFNAEITWFRIDIDDQILRLSSADDNQNANAGETVHQGLETAFRLDSDQLFGTTYNYYLMASYTFLDAFFDNDLPNATDGDGNPTPIRRGNLLPYAPAHVVNANVGVETPWGLDVRFGVHSVSRQFVDPHNTTEVDWTGREGTIPGYTTFSTSANYKVTKNFDVFMNAYNLSSKKYVASRVDGIHPGQQFQIMGGARISF